MTNTCKVISHLPAATAGFACETAVVRLVCILGRFFSLAPAALSSTFLFFFSSAGLEPAEDPPAAAPPPGTPKPSRVSDTTT
ncbi:hypothetical protein HanXRQr2_Chr13g0570341 [Helianthus annuus]|uniref:Uncharacterized protein n=1 Tax=Helianthus annuus TaxID=4232 RepID=A0A9K3EEU8_HELAN|nr:hypothetical protein HanXRQr2_Chr13g0570341 [Helianthus annuus]KAJ0847775.1 hypothetical protein HanPSC8_Chr13g0549151 [Helianthus annuus]